MLNREPTKWPIRYQIMLPMTVLMLVTVAGLSLFDLYRAAAQQRSATEKQIRDIASTLADSRFPLTDNVLQQMKGLSGAEFVLVNSEGKVQATTRGEWLASNLPKAVDSPGLNLSKPHQIAGDTFYHATTKMQTHSVSSEGNLLHIFYATSLYDKQRRDAIFPTLVIGGAALLLVAGVALLIASRVSRPLRRLRAQVGNIAEGVFEPIPLPARGDEVYDLSAAVNRMAEMLASFETTIRQTEQLRTLGQLGGALAHQLRNSATGARMALDIHRGECAAGETAESLDVASRQLILMEKYLQRFLSLGTRQSRAVESLDFAELVNSLLPLLGPAAKHANVRLDTELPDTCVTIDGERDGLEHLILNLLLNGIEAAAEARATDEQKDACVRLVLSADDSRVVMRIEDNGAGPPSEIATTLFDSFVTCKADGVGLGLAIAKQVVNEHHGEIAWSRDDGVTTFQVELPATRDTKGL